MWWWIKARPIGPLFWGRWTAASHFGVHQGWFSSIPNQLHSSNTGDVQELAARHSELWGKKRKTGNQLPPFGSIRVTTFNKANTIWYLQLDLGTGAGSFDFTEDLSLSSDAAMAKGFVSWFQFFWTQTVPVPKAAHLASPATEVFRQSPWVSTTRSEFIEASSIYHETKL